MSFPCHARFAHPDAGYEAGQRNARVAGLVKDRVYPVVRLDVGRSDSSIELDGFPGYRFNAVMFEPADPGWADVPEQAAAPAVTPLFSAPQFWRDLATVYQAGADLAEDMSTQEQTPLPERLQSVQQARWLNAQAARCHELASAYEDGPDALGVAIRGLLRTGADVPEPTLAEAMEVAAEADQRAGQALNVLQDGQYDGENHKAWAIDQAVRYLLGCPEVEAEGTAPSGQVYHYTKPGSNAAYETWLAEHEGWEEGVAP